MRGRRSRAVFSTPACGWSSNEPSRGATFAGARPPQTGDSNSATVAECGFVENAAAGTPRLEPAPASFAEQIALRIVQLGAIAVVLAASKYTMFDLDRFFVPKELVLHLTALLAGLLALRALRRVAFDRLDLLLALYIVISALSAVFATNGWNATRAVAISASGIALFWIARGLGATGFARPVLRAIALAIVVAAVTALLQTYGLRLDVFSLNRAPGGTLGNRNFVSHAAAFGFPVVLLVALLARRRFAFLTGAAGVALVTATLVLTRSRAAWLAFAAVGFVFFAAMILSLSLRRDGRTWRRLLVVVVLACAGVGAALVIPNTLRWRSDNPYLDSMRGMADYEEGSGHGRLVQYVQSLRMALHHPLLGVGPGNWAVEYPAYAIRNDPSLDPSIGGMSFNPWPSSDWVASVAERGPFATILLALALMTLLASAFRQLRSAADAESATLAAALLGTIAAAGVAGLFDAVLLLPLPSLLVWTALGALSAREPLAAQPAAAAPRNFAVAAVLLVAAIGAVRSAAQLTAMNISATHGDRASLERASAIDPGNYRLHLRLSRGGKRATRCVHALAAHELFPNAQAARALSSGCR